MKFKRKKEANEAIEFIDLMKWFEQECQEASIVSDGNGKWAVVCFPITEEDSFDPKDKMYSFLVMDKDWCDSIKDAINKYKLDNAGEE